MKKLSVRCNEYIIICGLCLMTSCNNYDPEIDLKKDREIAMEVYSHSTVIDQFEYLQSGVHDEFLHPEILSQLDKDPFLKQKLRVSSTEESDTIFSYDEIPQIRESTSYTCIYQDGTLESSIDHLTPFAANTVFQLNENPPSEKTRISKTIIENGYLKIYNNEGELITQESYPVSDMKEFLDTMKMYVQLSKENVNEDEENNAQIIRASVKNNNKGINISRLPNGNVVLEFSLQEMPAEMTGLCKVPDILNSRTELSEDMSKTLKFELFNGEYLIQRKVYTYNNRENLRNFHHDEVIGENPEFIESESLMLNSKGFPVLHHTKEFFNQNQTYYYFKD